MFRASKEERGTDNRLPQLYNSRAKQISISYLKEFSGDLAR
jgi:hypothetical protein